MPEAVRTELKEKYGYTIQSKADWEYIGYMGAIGVDAKTGRLFAGSDPRSDSMALAW